MITGHGKTCYVFTHQTPETAQFTQFKGQVLTLLLKEPEGVVNCLLFLARSLDQQMVLSGFPVAPAKPHQRSQMKRSGDK